MKHCIDTLQHKLQERTQPVKHHASHTPVTTTDLGKDNNNQKPVLILAITTPIINLLKATVAISLSGILPQGT